ncbi:hypothetical protein WA556_002071, partial [Blastocystis sp. ATCC 50177/Nand II]
MDFNSYLTPNGSSVPPPNAQAPSGNANSVSSSSSVNPAANAPVMPSQQSAMYPPANGYYYPYYYTPTVQISPQGANYQYAPCYYPQQSGMDSQTLMNQFAQFMSMMSSGMLPQQPPMQPVIEGQKFPPPDNYVCNRCKQKGHWIQFCPYAKKKNQHQGGYAIQTAKIECPTCKKWFISEEKKEEHMRKHEKCPYPGCSFNAIEKVLRDHIASVHQKGEVKVPQSLLELIPEKYRYAAKIGNNPEEIRKWREERKRHYPTEKRITEKEEAKKAVKEAGGLEEAEKRPKVAGVEEKVMVKLQGKRVPLCQNYMRGTCKFGTKCKLLHDPCRKNKSLCKAFVRGYCARGMNCKKLHSPSDRLMWLKQSMVEPDTPSLLTQLLSDDVFKENSCILQCLQYIVNEGMIPVPESLKKKVSEAENAESTAPALPEAESSSASSDTSGSSSSDSSDSSDSDSDSSSDTSDSSSSENEEHGES